MDNLQIRQARLEDLDAIVQLLRRDTVGKNTGPGEDYRSAFEDIANHPDNELVVAVLDGEVVGTLQLTFIPGMSYRWRMQVESVRVRQDLRNLRIGTRLMEWVIAQARERNCALIQLTTNVARRDAQRFYQRLGFESSHVGMKLFL